MSKSSMQKPIARAKALASNTATVIVVTALMLPGVALAHPGHGDGGFSPGLLHAFHGIDHIIAAVAIGLWAGRLGGRAIFALPLAFVIAMAAGVGLARVGIALPMIEPMIAASVLFLGALIALDARWSSTIGMLLVAAFAPFHAAAHVAKMPGAASVLPFAAGLLASTALLHAGGVGAALGLRARPLALRLAAAPIAMTGIWLLLARAG